MELKILRLVINRSIILDGPTFYNHGCLSCVAVTLTHVIVNVKRVHFLAPQIKYSLNGLQDYIRQIYILC